MPRNRMIKPEFWDDEKMATISQSARLTYIALWNFSDDYGVVKGHINWLKNNIYPYDENLKVDTFKKWLFELESMKRIIPFSSNGEVYYYLPKFLDHQSINRPSKQRNPPPPNNISESSLSVSCVLMDEKKYKRSIKEKKEKEKMTPPLIEDVINYFKENGYSEESAKKAYEYYKELNWSDSNSKKIISWKSKMIAVWFKPENKDDPGKRLI